MAVHFTLPKSFSLMPGNVLLVAGYGMHLLFIYFLPFSLPLHIISDIIWCLVGYGQLASRCIRAFLRDQFIVNQSILTCFCFYLKAARPALSLPKDSYMRLLIGKHFLLVHFVISVSDMLTTVVQTSGCHFVCIALSISSATGCCCFHP